MKIRKMAAAVAVLIVAVALVLLWPRSGSSESALDDGDPAVAGIAGDRPAETTGGDTSEAAAANTRFRATQRPEPRTYIKPEPEPHPTAVAVEGTPGFVLSPFNHKMIDVRDIPGGTLVADPTFPMSEGKFFRVPNQEP
jgi:hypothetical protein